MLISLKLGAGECFQLYPCTGRRDLIGAPNDTAVESEDPLTLKEVVERERGCFRAGNFCCDGTSTSSIVNGGSS